MLQMFAFDRVAMVMSDLYFVDPQPAEGQEGAERGVRLELRRIEAGEVDGSIYASRPIALGDPIWRIDLLETAAGPMGTFDRTHHHPRFRGWEPSRRTFVPELSADPLAWLEAKLSDLAPVLEEARVEPGTVTAADISGIQGAAPEIVAATRRLLEGVHRGELAVAPEPDMASARVSWL